MVCEGDCDDADGTSWPGAAEDCDGEDNDCDGTVPDDEVDNDSDGFAECELDCDDTDDETYPGAAEQCDGLDNDCDTLIGQEEMDLDGDGYTLCAQPLLPPDCDDSDPDTHPGAPQICDGIDNSCDMGLPPEELDDDGDGYMVCESDCDDNDPDRFPGNPEVCDGGVDNDCDAGTVEGTDADGDGWTDCDTPPDCDDGDAGINPDEVDTECDGIDQDCDGEDLVPLQAWLDTADADGMFVGASSDDYAGRSVDFAGDVDGDGTVDVLVGANYADGDYSRSGEVYLVYGPHGWYLDLGSADATFSGQAENAYAGFDLAGVGDTDGDGKDDFLIGAYGDDGGGTLAGEAYLILGPPADPMVPDVTFAAEGGANYAGRAVDGAGDVDGDGLADLIIGADGNGEGGTNAGAAYLVLGEDGLADMSLGAADAKYLGTSNGDRAGIDVAGVGDVNGDGHDDMLVGAYGASYGGVDGGVAYLIHGSPTPAGLTLAGANAMIVAETDGDQMGYRVAGAGDVNGDGYDDVLVGAPKADGMASNSGIVVFVHGPIFGAVESDEWDAEFQGEADDDELGMAVDGAGDVNGDGYDDVLFGAWQNQGNASDAGRAYLFFGPVTGTLGVIDAEVVLSGENSTDKAGTSVAGGGDLDGDGLDDILIGAVGADYNANWSGTAFYLTGPVICN